MHIRPVSNFRGEIKLPGDKSISHRYAILGSMANGITRIKNFSDSHDCHSTLNCLKKIGVRILRNKEGIEIISRGWENFSQPCETLNAENSGTTLRLLSALLASSPFTSKIRGDSSLNRRPMNRIVAPLRKMGARIQAHKGTCPPLLITGSQLRGINYRMPVASAQVKSCLLLAGLMAKGQTVIEEETPTRDHTEKALSFFGADFQQATSLLTVSGPASLKPTNMIIPGDFSSAAFFITAALLIPNSRLRLQKVGVNSTRSTLLDLIEQSGGRVKRTKLKTFNAEPYCDLTVSFSPETLRRFPHQIKGDLIPKLIDEIPILAILGLGLSKGLTVRDAKELRKKESDRIHSIVVNFRQLGVKIEEYPDGFYLPPGQKIRGGKIQTFGDHRVAMAFAIAGTISKTPVEIDDPSSVSISFPNFFKALQSLSLGS